MSPHGMGVVILEEIAMQIWKELFYMEYCRKNFYGNAYIPGFTPLSEKQIMDYLQTNNQLKQVKLDGTFAVHKSKDKIVSLKERLYIKKAWVSQEDTICLKVKIEGQWHILLYAVSFTDKGYKLQCQEDNGIEDNILSFLYSQLTQWHKRGIEIDSTPIGNRHGKGAYPETVMDALFNELRYANYNLCYKDNGIEYK